MKKGLSVLLALLMILCVIPFASFADEDTQITAAERKAVWDEDYEIVVDKLLDNENSSHWKYVVDNNTEISNKMALYTAFGLYDDAWKNGFDNSISVDAAEKMLCSLIARVDATVGDSVVAKIVNVLDTATDVNDLIQKVNDILQKINKYAKAEALDKIDGVVAGETWSTVFQYVEWAIRAGNLYGECRDKVIEAYSQILSVQAANVYFVDFLKYIVDTTDDYVLGQAAYNLSTDINESVEAIIKKEALNAAGFAASRVLETAANIACDTNSYTAVAKKVYNKATGIVDTLWNTSDQYALMDELYTCFFAEEAAAAWVKTAEEADKYTFAVGTLLALRQVGAETLYNLKVAESGGIIGKVTNEINAKVSFLNVAELAFLDLANKVLFTDNFDGAKKVDSVLMVASDAFADVNGVAAENVEGIAQLPTAEVSIRYSDAYDYYVKVYFVNGDADVNVRYPIATTATLVLERLEEGAIAQYSFTEAAVGEKTTIKFNTGLTDGTYTVDNGAGNTSEAQFNTEFVAPAMKEVSKETVIKAVTEVAVKEAKAKVKGIFEIIKEYYAKIMDAIGKIFKKK